MQVEELMTQSVHCCRAGDSLEHAAEIKGKVVGKNAAEQFEHARSARVRA